MKLQELLALSSPSCVVASGSRRPDFFRVHLLVFLTVLLSRFHQLTTAGMLARDLWFVWHPSHLHKKSPGGFCNGPSRLHLIFFADYTISHIALGHLRTFPAHLQNDRIFRYHHMRQGTVMPSTNRALIGIELIADSGPGIIF